MAIAVDGSSPLRFTGTWNVTSGGAITSALFTAPSDAFLVLCAGYDTSDSATPGATSANDTGGLTWTKRPERLGTETTAGGGSVIFTARTTSAASRTVSFAGASGAFGGWGTGRASAKLYVLTGVDVNGTPVDTVTASNEGTGSTQTNQALTALTPSATGLHIAATAEWQAKGAISSSDLTVDHGEYAGVLDVADGYKTCTVGVSSTAHFTAAGAGPQWKWVQIIVLEAAGGGGGGKPWLYYQQMRQYRQEQRQQERLVERAYRETILRKVA